MRRNEEVINVRDAVLLKSGPRKKDLPFVARVSGIWEDDEGKFIRFSWFNVFFESSFPGQSLEQHSDFEDSRSSL